MISFNENTLILILALFCVSTAIKHIQCPDSSQWKFRQSGFCNKTHQWYYCLYDENLIQYMEFCGQKPELQRPGYKFIVRGNLDGSQCIKSRYQPTKFWTNGSSECIFKKSNCSEEGMIIQTEGNSTSDKMCRCDYTKGYAFVKRPKRKCVCNPNVEDCSCYRKPCKESQVLTPDYNCISTADWTGVFNCTIIKRQQAEMEAPENKKACTEACTEQTAERKRYQKEKIVFTATLIPIMICIGIVMFFTVYNQGKFHQIINRNVNLIDTRVDEQLDTKLTERIKNIQIWQKGTHTAQSNKLWCCLNENYRDIIYTINNCEITEHLVSKEIFTASDREEIYACLGQRKKNQKLLEKVFKIGIQAQQEFMVSLTKNEEYAILKNQIEESKGLISNDIEMQDDHNERIPKKERDVFETYIAHWFQEDRKFTVTSGTRKIEGMLKQNNCVLVVGRSGNGKSATVRHLALKHFDEEGFDIVPIVLPTTILQYYNPERKQLFIVDDFCGKNVINAQIVDNWSLHIHDVLKLLTNNQENNEGMSGQGTVKLVFATDPSIYKDTVFHRIHIPLECTFDLSNQPLQDEEKIEMFKKFRTEKKMSDDFTRTFQGHDNIFPLLCKYSEGKTEAQIIQLFTNPYNVIKQDFVALNKTNKDQMCLISLCILLESIHADVFRQENIHIKDKVVIDAVCSEFDLDFCNETTKSKLVAELNHLEKTYLAKTGDSYYIEHIDIYEIAAVVCGEVIKESFIRFAPSSMIAERYSFIPSETKDSTNLILIKDTDIQKRYFDRLMDDLERRITYSVFHNSQLKDKTYRDKFCEYCRRRQQKVKDLLNRLQKHTSEQSENQIDNTTEKGDNEYEDYIKFTEQYHFSTHRMQIPLIESTWEGYEDIVNLLIEMECDVNETDKFGRSSLFVACHLGRTNVAVQLLDKGAKHSLCDNNEAASPLHAACIGGDSKIVEALLAKGADTSARDKKGYSPFLAATEAGHKKILEKLLADKKNANINQKDNFDRSALFHASYNGRKEIVDLLLEKGADIEECDKQGFSPLLAACFMGKLNVVVDLLEKKADISKVDIDGRSALFMACEKGDNRIVEILLQKDADVSQCDWLQRSPLFIACTFEHEQIVRLLVKYKADISQCDQDGRSPLFIACEKGHDAIFNILLEKCQNDVLEKADHKDRSPLYVASRGGFLEIVKKLVSKGSKINKCNAWQMTPLFVACREGNADVVKYLIDSNADLNAADYNGQSPLSIACDNGYADVVTILVENDVNVYHVDNDHKTPLELAENRGHTNIVDILNGVINRNRPYC